MAETYKTKYGIDWPAAMPDILIGLTVGKKWRLLEEATGVRVERPWEALLDSAKRLLSRDEFRVSEWTEQHFHDFTMYDKLITWGCASSSKAQPLDELVCTPQGFRPMGDIKAGDFVTGSDGKPTRVLKTTDVGKQDVYAVAFSDGTEVRCAGSHLWRVTPSGGHKVPKVISTAELGQLSGRPPCRVQLCGPVEFESGDPLPIDPYVMGCLLGDGSTHHKKGVDGCGCLRLTNTESDLTEEVSRRLDPAGLKLSGGGKGTYRIVNKERSRVNAYMRAAGRLGLWEMRARNKRVPKSYLEAPVKVREDVLAGLMDTDGTVDKRNGRLSFTSMSRGLAEDAAWLARSLGGKACVRSKKVPGDRVAYVTGINIESPSRLFKIKRKRDAAREMSRGRSKTIVAVEKTGARAPMRCLTVDALDGQYVTEGFTVTHNSNDTALLLLLDWIVDPYDTVTLLGSTTKEDLKSRSWEAVERYHHAIRNNKLGLTIPGKISKQGQRLVNFDEDDVAGSSGEKAGIQGRAINEGGRLQGAHAKYVRLVVDELAEITNHEAIKTAIANLRVGTLSFKFIGLANPESWDNPSCQYCIPEQGIGQVDADTGTWTSTFGCFVRHHDGLKSPCVLHPELKREFPFLLSEDTYLSTLREAGGNPDAPQIWKMIRGFPVPSGTAIPSVLDPKVASENRVAEPLENPEMHRVVGVAAGIDPAWSEGGDGAYRCRVIVRDVMGKAVLDFGDGLSRLTISATDSRPVTKQLRDQTLALMRRPGLEARLQDTAVDSSGNQGLADDLDIVLGAECLHVNSSQRASDAPLRATDSRKAKEIVYDRGTEAWAVLAEFCRAGMVRGLPQEALAELTQRRYACKAGTTQQLSPLRLEGKDRLRLRIKKSPDEADACALAALAVKERLGILPFGFLSGRESRVDADAFFGMRPEGRVLEAMPDSGAYEDSFDYGAYEPI